MTYSKNWLDIANRALAKTGNQLIDNFTGGDDNIKLVNTLLPEAVEVVASLFPWRSLTKRKALAPSDTAPEFGFEYAYPLPTNFARVVEVIVENDSNWVREAGEILTDSSFCNLIYLMLPEEPTDLSPSVRELIVIRLAYNIVQTTTSNTTLMTQLSNEYQSALVLAEREETQGELDIIDFEVENNR